jgi:hypothetical protein
MEEDVFGLIGKGLNDQICCWLDWNGLEGRSFVVACLEWLGMEAVDFVLTWPTPNAKKPQAKQNSKRKRTKKSKKNIIDFQKEDEKRTKKKKSKLCQKVAKKVDKKLSKSCQKVVKKFVLNLETRLDVKHCGSKANS